VTRSKSQLCGDLAPSLIAITFILFGVALRRLEYVRPGYDVIWFEPLLLQLGFAWLGLSVLLAAWQERSLRNRSVFRLATWSEVIFRHARLYRIGRYLSVALVLPPFITTFAGLKQSIPLWIPFEWDTRFYKLDKVIHGGRLPSDIGSSFLMQPEVTLLLDRVYYLWFPVLILTVTWYAWTESSPVRNRFLVNYFLIWVLLGIGAATMLSSAGPCYYAYVAAGPDPYEGLMQYLRRLDSIHGLTTIRAQDYLWTGYVTGRYSTEGISAMPSMHVAMAALFCFSGFSTHRILGCAYGLFLLLILIGSVHLGWHYAIDGYVSIVLVAVAWWLSGRLGSRTEIRNA
jgi:hypothetical protein